MVSGPVILITGASSGIGAAVARRLARPGVNLVLHASGREGVKQAALDALAASLAQAGAGVMTHCADLAEPDAGTRLVEAALVRFGGVDQIISNAGFADRTPFFEVDRAQLDKSFQVMTGAFFDMARAAAEPLSRSGSGRVVAISSFVAHRFAADGLFAVTAAAKAGLEALAKTLAVELGPKGVTVNCVVPGYTRKDASGHRAIPESVLNAMAERTPTRRIGDPEDVAELIGFLTSPAARQITGQVINVDGGLCLG